MLSGPSGVGKTTICERILASRSDVRYSVSATSRPRRPVEKDGREYIFLTVDDFRRWIEQGLFVEYAEVYGNYYGTPKETLEQGLSDGYNILLDIDVQGARKLMDLYPDGIFIYVMPPDIAELARRLRKRDTDHDEVIRNRLEKARNELGYRDDYKYSIVNEEIDKTVSGILGIIEKELGPAPPK